MTKLDAVNHILRVVGLPAVPALDTGGASRAAEAERILDEEELRVQSERWNYNTRTNVTLTPNGSNQIAVPANVIEIWPDQGDRRRNLVQTGGLLYDADENTSTFDGTIKASYTLRYEFDCIPYRVRRLIAETAARRFDEAFFGGQRAAVLRDNEHRARGEAHRHDTRSRWAGVNILETIESQRVKGRRYDYERNFGV